MGRYICNECWYEHISCHVMMFSLLLHYIASQWPYVFGRNCELQISSLFHRSHEEWWARGSNCSRASRSRGPHKLRQQFLFAVDNARLPIGMVKNRALGMLNSIYGKKIKSLCPLCLFVNLLVVSRVTIASGEYSLRTLTLIKIRLGSSVSQDTLSSLMILQLSSSW